MTTLESRLNSDYDFLDDGEDELLGAGGSTMNSNKRSLDDANMDENGPENGAADDEVEALKGASDGKEGDGAEDLKKKKVKRRTFNDTILTSQSGLVQVYETFPGIFANAGKQDKDIANDLKKLIMKYKEWGFQLFPNLAFEDLVNRCESLGSKGSVRGYMDTLRDRERTHYLNTVLEVPLEDIISNADATAMPNQDMDSPVRVEKEEEQSKETQEEGAKTNQVMEDDDIDYNDYIDHDEPVANGAGAKIDAMTDMDLMMLQAMEQAEQMTQSLNTANKDPSGGATATTEATTAITAVEDSDDELLVVEGMDDAPEVATAPDQAEMLTAPAAEGYSQTQVDDESAVAPKEAPGNPYGEFEVPEDWGEE